MRRRWIQIDGELVEVTPGMENSRTPSAKDTGILWNDREYQNMGDPRFKSRSEHRAYMAANGLATADDFKETWRKKEEQRNRAMQGYDPTRREDLTRAIEILNSGDDHARR